MAKILGERWEIQQSLGEGGQAFTYLVKDIKSDQQTQYVLKRLKNPHNLDRFKKEVQSVQPLDHPNIIKIIDFELDNEPYFFVTEHCEGASLDKAYPYWRRSPSNAFDIFLEICDAIVYCHSNGIIHRDIKPANVFLRSETGPAVLGDFGICFLEADPERLTLTQEAVGPRLFMAPELEDGRLDDVSDKCDVYSLGKLLYWLFSKRGVFSREKYREKTWDLKGHNLDTLLGWDNIFMEHVNRLLDFMIVSDPDKRRSAANIDILSKHYKKYLEKEFIPVSQDYSLPCTFCGQGAYVKKVSSSNDLYNFFAINPIGSADWRILACNMCDHVQLFRVDLASRKDWWSKGEQSQP